MRLVSSFDSLVSLLNLHRDNFMPASRVHSVCADSVLVLECDAHNLVKAKFILLSEVDLVARPGLQLDLYHLVFGLDNVLQFVLVPKDGRDLVGELQNADYLHTVGQLHLEQSGI